MRLKTFFFVLTGAFAVLSSAGTVEVRAESLHITAEDRAELAVFQKGKLKVLSDLGATVERSCGGAGDIALPGNYWPALRARFAAWNPSFGIWHICGEGLTLLQPWGQPGDVPVPADYDGDGVTELGVFRPTTAQWYLLRHGSDIFASEAEVIAFGSTGDVPVPADYDGDGSSDLAVFRQNDENGGAEWEIRFSAAREQDTRISFGLVGDVPVAADYDGDGAAEIAVWRPTDGTWYVRQGEETLVRQFGLAGDVPSPVDFDGDGADDYVVYRPSQGEWYVLTSSGDGSEYLRVVLGGVGDRVANHTRAAVVDRKAPLDFDGDRVSDLAVVRVEDSGALRFLVMSGSGSGQQLSSVIFGALGDAAVPRDYDGDGVSDLAVVEAAVEGMKWRFRFSSEQQNGIVERIVYYGLKGDQILPADYDGDGKSDVCVVRNLSDGSKLWLPSTSTLAPLTPVSWGFASDTALTADFDGDAKSDQVVVREQMGELLWLVRTAAGSEVEPRLFGFVGDRPFVGDYDGDGRAEIGVLRRLNGFWMVIIDGKAPYFWGFESDAPLAGDYAGTGAANRAVWRVVNGQGFFFLAARAGASGIEPFGVVGDIPLDPLGVTTTTSGGSGSSSSGRRLSCATRSAVTGQEAGFVWEPLSEEDGKLVVIFGTSRLRQIKRVALVQSGVYEDVVLETLSFGGNLDNERPVFRGAKAGSAYPIGVILVRQDQEGTVHCIDVPDPAVRYSM